MIKEVIQQLYDNKIRRISIFSGLSFEEIQEFGLALASNKSAKALSMMSCRLPHLGAKILAQALRENTTLEIIGLINCWESNVLAGISDESVKMIAEALAANTGLIRLVLSGITDQGAAYLAYGLSFNTKIKELLLPANRMTEQGVKTLIQLLKINNNIIKLEVVSLVPLKPELQAILDEALNENRKRHSSESVGETFNKTKKIKTESEKEISLIGSFTTEMGNTPFHFAAEKNDINTARVLIQLGKNIEDKNMDGETPLHRAAAQGNLDMVKFLIEQGANCEAFNNEKETPIQLAFDGGHSEIIKIICTHLQVCTPQEFFERIKKGDVEELQKLKCLRSYLDMIDTTGMRPIHWAATLGHKIIVKMLIEVGVNIHVKRKLRKINLLNFSQVGFTPLHFAADTGREDIVELLIVAKANVNATSRYPDESPYCCTPLFLAAYIGNETIVRLLIQAGAEVEAKNDAVGESDGITPLHVAVKEGYPDIVRLLINASANPNCTDDEGNTPLHYLLQGRTIHNPKPNHHAVIEQLVKAKCDINAPCVSEDYYSQTSLHIAAANDAYTAIVQSLINNGVQVNIQDDDGYTPLHVAAFKGSLEITKLLIASGAFLEAKTKGGCTPLHQAVIYNHKPVVSVLLERGADPMATNTEGKTPAHIAKERGHHELIELFDYLNVSKTILALKLMQQQDLIVKHKSYIQLLEEKIKELSKEAENKSLIKANDENLAHSMGGYTQTQLLTAHSMLLSQPSAFTEEQNSKLASKLTNNI